MNEISARNPGTLYVVATPIGNREDITLRALATLQSVDAILAEDTRHSMQLLTLLGIKKPLISLHTHNEKERSLSLINELLNGKSFALISDAGTPLISDPGFPLVSQAQTHHISVVPIPGACALIAALSAAGVACDAFSFLGFLPAKQAARRDKLKSVYTIEHTLVFYESTHRILDSLDDITFVFGDDCQLVLAKELTKTFERFIKGDGATIKAWLLADKAHSKGEFVLMIPPRNDRPKDENKLLPILTVLLTELPLKQAVKLTSKITGENKNEVYDLALKCQLGLDPTSLHDG